MAKCTQCGNDYDKSFEVKMGGRTMIFDSFECAIQALAPVCPHCGCRIIGHGVASRQRLNSGRSASTADCFSLNTRSHIASLPICTSSSWLVLDTRCAFVA